MLAISHHSLTALSKRAEYFGVSIGHGEAELACGEMGEGAGLGGTRPGPVLPQEARLVRPALERQMGNSSLCNPLDINFEGNSSFVEYIKF